MNRVFLFNPENDIALAAGRQNFTPPKAAVQMALSGATLPWWLGDSDDYLLLSTEMSAPGVVRGWLWSDSADGTAAGGVA